MQAPLSRRPTDAYRHERGAVLLLAAFLLVAVLLLAGLAIDAGNLFRARLALQRASDAGALAGLGYVFLRGEAETDADIAASGARSLKEFVEQKADEIAAENVRASRLGLVGAPEIASAYDEATEQLSVNIAADIRLLLMPHIPMEVIATRSPGSARRLGARAATERAAANIELVLDVSKSMRCPEGAGATCECLTPGAAPCSGRRKFDALVDATIAFFEEFDARRDRIGITIFDTTATTVFPIGAAPIMFDPASFDTVAIRAALESFSPTGATNISAGLIRAYKDLDDAGIIPDTPAAIVLFSDGAPDAGRFLLAQPLPGLEPHNPDGLGSHDYIHHAVRWYPSPGAPYTGPSLWLKTRRVPAQWNEGRAPSNATPNCNDSYAESTPPFRSGEFPGVFDSCVQTMAFHLPKVTAPAFAGDIANAGNQFTAYSQMYYISAVQMAEFLRSQNSVIYVVGLGSPAAMSDSDPYQGAEDTLSRKDVFLTKLANDYLRATDLCLTYTSAAPNDPERGCPHPEFQYQGSTDYGNARQLANSRAGWYASLEPSEIDRLSERFRQIATRVKLRLVE
jgi:Flp pilus assembly protein TadG